MELIATQEMLRQAIVIGAVGLVAIEQNMRIIIKTLAYSVALDRSFAGTGAFIDSPSPHHTARLIAQLTKALEEKEPRIKIKSIRLTTQSTQAGMAGTLHPIISYALKEGVIL